MVVPFSKTFIDIGNSAKQGAMDFLWLRDGRLKASYFAFHCDVDIGVPTAGANEFRQRWDNYMSSYNGKGSRSGWGGSNGEFHTSELWVRADVQEELVSSMVTTLLIIVVLAGTGVLLFT